MSHRSSSDGLFHFISSLEQEIMTDQRFRYYTGYEVDNEPSDDENEEEEVNPSHKAITQGQGSSDR